MKHLPLFDSATHPAIQGGWLASLPDIRNDVSDLLREMTDSDVRWALALGMAGIGGYDAEAYADFVRSASPKLLPVAYCEFDKLPSTDRVKPYVSRLASRGYAGLKIHPRFSHVPLTHPYLEYVIKASNDAGLFVCLCTMLMHPVCGPENSMAHLMALLGRVSTEKMILLHGCTVRVLELMEMAKVFKNKLVDLSYTLLKYEGSSVDADIRWLFQHCDRRICVGSDHPEWPLKRLRARFETFAAGLDDIQAENIAYKNLAAFCGVNHAQ
jgi:predicted TIM-barrel fold metal-dependent hydrolase